MHPRSLRPFSSTFGLLALAALSPAHAAGATLSVPSQYQTIQAAVSAAASGDTVLIADGTYTGPGNVDVDFGGKNLTVTSQHGPASTIIDCGGSPSVSHRGFYVHQSETAAVISGLTIENANTISGTTNGGAISTYNVSLTVQNCILKNNTAQDGGGLTDYNYVGTVTVSHCVITGNTATTVSGGGGIFNFDGSNGSTVVTDCTITGNMASANGGSGGGLTNENFGGGTISVVNCNIIANSASHGGGIDNLYDASSGPILVTNCTLASNTSTFSSGGVFNENSQNNGGSTSPILLTNDIFYGDGGSEIVDNPNSTATETVTHCDVQGGYAGTGNVSADPLFVNPPQDVHLEPGSPCLGAGTANGAPTTDKDGVTRPNPPSIGAYELAGANAPPVTHLLWNNTDGKAAFWNVKADGTAAVAGVYGPFTDSGQGLWHATALATGPDGVSHLLWNSSVGQVALWNVTDGGAANVLAGFGPYTDGSPQNLWRATGLSVGPDGVMHLLWTNVDHKAAFWNVTPSGSTSVLAGYGPYFDGNNPWDAAGVSTGPDNVSHLLWHNTDGTAAFWNVSDGDGSLMVKGVYGPFTDGSPNAFWGAIGVSTGPDGVSHLLWDNVDGKAAFWNVSSADGSATALAGYGPFTDGSPQNTWSATGLTTGPDNVSRLLWNNPDGKVALWTLGVSGSPSAVFGFGPYTDGAASNLWSAVGLSAGP